MKLKEEWIDRIFFKLEEIYQADWRRSVCSGHLMERVHKANWATALADLNPFEIRRGLSLCETLKTVPGVIDFWHRCKGLRYLRKVANDRSMADNNRAWRRGVSTNAPA